MQVQGTAAKSNQKDKVVLKNHQVAESESVTNVQTAILRNTKREVSGKLKEKKENLSFHYT